MHQSPVTHLEFLITEELAAIHSIKGTLFIDVTACLDSLGLKWDKLCPEL